jgi:hypothetical protein
MSLITENNSTVINSTYFLAPLINNTIDVYNSSLVTKTVANIEDTDSVDKMVIQGLVLFLNK